MENSFGFPATWLRCSKQSFPNAKPLRHIHSDAWLVLAKVLSDCRPPTKPLYKHGSQVRCKTRQHKGCTEMLWASLGSFLLPSHPSSPLLLPAASITQTHTETQASLSFSRKHAEELPGKLCTPMRWQGLREHLSKPHCQEKP